MPELPDVEGFRRVLAEHGTRRRIRGVRVADPQILHGVSAKALRETLVGHRFGKPERHGKWLIVPLSNRAILLLHFGMTGSIVWTDTGAPPHPHDRVSFAVRDGELRFRDMRKLQGIWLVADRASAGRRLADVGPDALAIGRDRFDEVTGTGRQLKATLIDQSALAGLGNLLADEICWHARVHPRRRGDTLTATERRKLYAAMRRVLRTAIPTGRVPGRRSWLTGHRDDPGQACPRCGTTLRRGRAAGRGTVWCPECQPAPTGR